WLVGQALHLATEPATARRIAARFRAAAAEPRPEGERAPPPRPPSPLEELIRAHRILGVPPTATNREVEAAWRKKRAEYHPDRAAQDPDEFERRSRISVELNWARDLIFSHRAGSARKPAA
ncbi:MAG TPA: J domain-containing protein, partial [Polyangiaceae bacterium]